MTVSMIEQALAEHKDSFGIEDFALVQRDGMYVLEVDFIVGIHANIYSTGGIEFHTTKPLKQKQIGGHMGIIHALAGHMEHYNETTKESNDDSTGTSNHP